MSAELRILFIIQMAVLLTAGMAPLAVFLGVVYLILHRIETLKLNRRK